MWVKNVTILIVFCHLVMAARRTPEAVSEDDSDITYNAASERDDRAISRYGENTQSSENSFYPSFSPFDHQPLGHSRPFYYNSQQEGAYSHRADNPYQNSVAERYSGYKDNQPSQKPDHLGILGSGNFGVISGGTFYSDNDNDNDQSSNYENYDSYLYNGHGRPSLYYNGAPNGKSYPPEQFSNFKDFADINTPVDRQYSHFVVVYVPKKNDTETDADVKVKSAPKNIMESLTMLDMEKSTSTEDVPVKKLSKFKRKLALLPPEKKHFQKTSASDSEEPLMALS